MRHMCSNFTCTPCIASTFIINELLGHIFPAVDFNELISLSSIVPHHIFPIYTSLWPYGMDGLNHHNRNGTKTSSLHWANVVRIELYWPIMHIRRVLRASHFQLALNTKIAHVRTNIGALASMSVHEIANSGMVAFSICPVRHSLLWRGREGVLLFGSIKLA